MKKKVYHLLIYIFMLLFALNAKAEISSNLQLIKETNPSTKKVIRETYVDSQGNISMAEDKGYASKVYAYNNTKLLTEVNCLDNEGNLTNCAEGYARILYEYKLRNLIRTAYFDANGQPCIGPEGFAVQEIIRGTRGLEKEALEYDAEGNLILHRTTEYVNEQSSNLVKSLSWFDAEGQPAAGPDGYAKVKYDYYKRKKCHTAYYNADGSLFFNSKDGFAEKEEIYVKGSVSELVFRGEDGNLMNGPQGYARATYTYAQGGKETLTMYYNADGSLFFTKDGYCGIKQIRENRRVVDECYYVGEGIRGYCKDGYSRTTKRYTSRSQIIQQCYFDEQDHLMIPPALGYAKIKNTYNTRYLLKTEYFDENDQPSYGPDGYAVVVYKIQNKLKTEATFYDKDGKTLINGKNGYAKTSYKYDSNKQCISEIHYDTEGNKTAISGDADEIRFSWENKQKKSESYWKDNQATYGSDGYHEVRYEYTSNNKVKMQSFYDIEGNPVQCTKGYASIEKKYNSQNAVTETLYYDVTGQLMQTPGKEYAYVLNVPAQEKQAKISDMSGDMVTENTVYVEFYGTDRKLMNLNSGYAYIIRQTDTQGRTVCEAYYDKDGQKALMSTGYDEIRYSYSNSSKPYRTEYFCNGMPVQISEGYAAVEREYDDSGNIIAERYYDAELQLTTGKNGYSQIRREYNDRNLVIYEAWYDEKGDRIPVPGNTYFAIKREYNELGLNTIQLYCDENDEPMSCKAGYEMIRREYNDEKRVKSEVYLDHNGKPMANQIGVNETAYEYNEKGKVIRETYYDSVGKPMICQKGYAGIEKLYNTEGTEQLATLYLDENGAVMATPGNEYAYTITYIKEDHESTEQNWITSENTIHTYYIEYYGTDRQLMNTSAGYAYIVRENDEQGRNLRETYYDKKGQKVILKGGYDEIRQYYNEGSTPSRIEYYLDNSPALRDGDYAVLEREYDERGNIIIERYYDAAFQPTSCKNGYEEIRREYNNDKKVSSEAYYDHDGNPMTNNKNVFRINYEYNENGKIILEAYYDSIGEPMTCRDGYARIERQYNEKGETTATLFYDTNGDLMLAPGKEYAYTITSIPGNKTEEQPDNYSVRMEYTEFYGTNRQLMKTEAGYAAILKQTDDQGRVVKEVYYDENGQKAILKGGYDEYRQVYNGRSNSPSRIEYYTDGVPSLNINGFAAVEREYDEAGNIIDERYYDANFLPMVNKNGYHEIRREYNNLKQIVYEALYDIQGKKTTYPNENYYAIRKQYDERGLVSEQCYLDENDDPTVCKAGYEMIQRTYDNDKRVAHESYMDHDGVPMMNQKGVYQTAYTYNENGKITSEIYSDSNGNLMQCKDGYAKIEKMYDSKDNVSATLYYNDADELILTPGKEYAYMLTVIEQENIDQGNDSYNTIYVEYYDTDRQLMNTSSGYAYIVRSMDKQGRIIGEAYYEQNGNRAVLKGGYDEFRQQYEDGNKPSRIEYCMDGDLILTANGYAVIEKEYDETGNTTEERYYGTSGNPVSCKNGYEIIRRKYNQNRKVIHEAYYDHDGAPMRNNKGVYQTAFEYNEKGQMIRESYYDGDGKPMVATNGFVSIERVYDEEGNNTEEKGITAEEQRE